MITFIYSSVFVGYFKNFKLLVNARNMEHVNARNMGHVNARNMEHVKPNSNIFVGGSCVRE